LYIFGKWQKQNSLVRRDCL